MPAVCTEIPKQKARKSRKTQHHGRGLTFPRLGEVDGKCARLCIDVLDSLFSSSFFVVSWRFKLIVKEDLSIERHVV